tara:strand:+ start:63 stop:212 length:150 start_codon:yes stop_codon:yes gene_type:complete
MKTELLAIFSESYVFSQGDAVWQLLSLANHKLRQHMIWFFQMIEKSSTL